MLDMLAHFLPKFVKPAQKPGETLTISIPKTHPKAEFIRTLAMRLATRVTLPSGLEIGKTFSDGEERVAAFTEALAEILDEEGVPFRELYQETFGEPFDLQQIMAADPGKLLHVLLSDTPLREAVSPKSRETLTHVIEGLKGR